MLRKLGVVALLALFVGWFGLLRPTSLGGPASYIMVSGASMEPTLYGGDLAVLRRREAYGLGDVVGFRVPAGVVIHRIVGGSAEEGYIMRGDNKRGADLWEPRPEDILGQMWFQVHGGGRAFSSLRAPLPLAALAGATMLLTLDDLTKKRRRRKRAGRAHAQPGTKGKRGLAPQLRTVWLGLVAVLALGFAAGAVYSFRQPIVKTEFVERLRYEHAALFNYTVRVHPSELYPGDVIGPIGPTSSGVASASKTSPIFTRLARGLDLDFTYLLWSSLPLDVEGELSTLLEIKAADGWTKTLQLSPPAPFVGSRAFTRASVDFSEVASLIHLIEEQTGFRPGTYDISVIPTIRVWGRVGQEEINETYAPAFAIKLNSTQISLDSELGRMEVRTVGDQVTRVQEVSLLGLSIPVTTCRVLSVCGAAISMVAAIVLAAMTFLGLGRGEATKIRARYRSMLVSVAQADCEGARKIRVASMRDLVRLAQRDGRIIFHQELMPDSHIYFINDGDAIYQYQVSERAEEG